MQKLHANMAFKKGQSAANGSRRASELAARAR